MKYKKFILQTAALIITSFFIYKYFLKNYSELSQYKIELNYRDISVSILFIVIVFLLKPFIWKRILYFLGTQLSYRESIEICSFSNLTRYVPGKIWSFLSRIYLTRNKHINKEIVVTSHGVQIIIELLVGIFVFLICLPFGLSLRQIEKFLWILIFIPFFLLFLFPPFLQRIINFGSKILHFKKASINLKFFNLSELLLLNFISWSFFGIAYFFAIRSLFHISSSLLPVVIGVYAISSVIAFLSFLTPAGLGVREGILSFLLSSYMPTSIAILVSLLARVCMVSTELVRAGVIVIMKRFSRGETS